MPWSLDSLTETPLINVLQLPPALLKCNNFLSNCMLIRVSQRKDPIVNHTYAYCLIEIVQIALEHWDTLLGRAVRDAFDHLQAHCELYGLIMQL